MRLSRAEAVKLVARYSKDPVSWAADVLDVHLWREQANIAESIVSHRITAAKSCHSVGKSMLAAVLILWWLYTRNPSKVITTATSKRQVDGIIWAEVATLHRRARVKLGGELSTSKLTLDSDWWGWGFTAPDYSHDRFQGFKSPHMLVIADEACGVKSTIFEGLDSLMTGQDARMLMIGNPTDATGDFGKAFKPRSEVSKISIDAFQTPNFRHFGITLADIRTGDWKAKITGAMPTPYLVTPQWVRDGWVKWGEDSPLFQSRVMARFPNNADKLIPLSWIEAANERWHALEDNNAWIPEERMGQDVARYGADASVTAIGHYSSRARQGIRQLMKRRGLNTVELEGHVLWAIRNEGSGVVRQVRVDADGLGAGPYDHLRAELGSMVIEMRGGFRANDPAQFLNRRAEWFWQLRTDLDPNNPKAIALPPDEDLTSQLTAMGYKLNPKGLIQIESKDDMRARGLPSPDEADAVAYCNAILGDIGTVAPDTSGTTVRNRFDLEE